MKFIVLIILIINYLIVITKVLIKLNNWKYYRLYKNMCNL